MARLTHRGIVRIFDAGRDGRGQFIVMERIDGRGLDAILRDEAPLDPGEAAATCRQVAAALAAAHAAGVVHRDLKPSNVMVAADGAARVLDFGVAPDPRGHDADRDRLGARDARIHGAGAGAGRAGRRPRRHLLARLHALRVPDRRAAVRRRRTRSGHAAAPARRRRGAVTPQPRRRPGARRARGVDAREGACRPPAERRRGGGPARDVADRSRTAAAPAPALGGEGAGAPAVGRAPAPRRRTARRDGRRRSRCGRGRPRDGGGGTADRRRAEARESVPRAGRREPGAARRAAVACHDRQDGRGHDDRRR